VTGVLEYSKKEAIIIKSVWDKKFQEHAALTPTKSAFSSKFAMISTTG
jgi:hypothetical protein